MLTCILVLVLPAPMLWCTIISPEIRAAARCHAAADDAGLLDAFDWFDYIISEKMLKAKICPLSVTCGAKAAAVRKEKDARHGMRLFEGRMTDG